MNKNNAAQLGQQVLENTIKVIMNLPDDEKMVLGTEVLTKEEIINKFWGDERFAFRMAEQLDKSVKEFLFRTQWNARRNKKRNNPGS
ncbi:hypothetical protein ES703_79406 [subsurface metagenome]